MLSKLQRKALTPHDFERIDHVHQRIFRLFVERDRLSGAMLAGPFRV